VSEALLVEAAPGGRLMLRFGARGYAVEPATLLDRAEHLGRRLFGGTTIAKAFLLSIVLALPVLPLAKSESASDAVTLLIGTPALLCFAYCMVGAGVRLLLHYILFALVALTLPLLIVPAYRRWLLGPAESSAKDSSEPIERRPGHVPASALLAVYHSGTIRSSTVSVHFSDGTHAAYTARGSGHKELIRQFRRIIAPRDLIPAAALGAPTAGRFRRGGSALPTPQAPMPPDAPMPPASGAPAPSNAPMPPAVG